MEIQTHKKDFFPCKYEIHTGKGERSSLRSSTRPKKTTLYKVLAPPVWQPRAFQLYCQQYFSLTNREGYDPLIWAEPRLTSKLRSAWIDKQHCDHSKGSYCIAVEFTGCTQAVFEKIKNSENVTQTLPERMSRQEGLSVIRFNHRVGQCLD